MRVFYSDEVAIPLPADHRFPATKYRLLRDALLRRRTVPQVRFDPAPAATWEQLALVHAPPYLAAVRDGTLSPAEQRRIGFPWSPELVERSRRSVGGTVAAARSAITDGYAANLAGGTHHGFADHGEGYCVFNDVAVAFRVLQIERPTLRGAVIDLDVHQGNGTAAIFAADPSMFTLSLHGRRNFPFRKERSSLDVELEDGCDDAAYLAKLDEALPAAFASLPDIVFYIAGADILDADTLGHLNVTLAGIEARDARVLNACESAGVPIVMVMGGGYARPIERTVEAHLASYEAIMKRAHRGPRW